MKPKHVKQALKAEREYKHLMFKLLIECWNDENPHFGGDMPHRYDGKEKECCYCGRPKDWKPINAGFIASELAQKGGAE